MEKRNIIISITTIILVGIVFMIVNRWETPNTNENNIPDNTLLSDGTNKYDANIINEVKKEINATADTEMYQIEEEYDGRKILQIRPNIQFETVLAGIIKQGQPTEEEIPNLLEKKPTQNGIWIAEQAREQFINQLKENQINNYTINEEGYLKNTEKEEKGEEEEKILNKAINANKLYIIDIAGTAYIRDEFTGEIVEYPFEKMDPYQVIDTYQNEDQNQIILEITTNQQAKLSKQEILEEILSYWGRF